MGFKHDKTIEYYTNAPITSPIGEDFVIEYKVNGSSYIIHCSTETYIEALEYIKNACNTNSDCKILTGYVDDGESVDIITEKILKFSGPNGDFYKNTPFEVKCSNISEFPITLVTDDLKIYSFGDDDTIDMSGDNYTSFRKLPQP
jgi:hypothetical protein